MAVDINKRALKIAKTNAANYQRKNIEFVQSDLFSNINADEKFAIVVSNPPYVSDSEYENLLPSAKAQPKEALVAASDGYFFYQEIFQKVGNFLATKFLLMVEISPSQEEKIIKLVIEYFPQAEVSIFPD
jgi:release factor glutamine methyltransferase